MHWLNYHHLHYFWLVAREGGVGAAAKVLRLSHSTVSAQIRQLEESLGAPLFDRSGRKLQLSELGRVAYRYADEIFSLGNELLDVAQGHGEGRATRLAIGVTGVVPKLVIRRLIEPALALAPPPRILCEEDRFERLLGRLATHELDVLLTDAPCPPGSGVRAFNHLLGECGVSLFAVPALARRLREGFPGSLDGAPLLVPVADSVLRRGLDQWLAERDLRPKIVAEIEDSALLKVMGQDGLGAFPAPSIVAPEICAQYGVERVAELEGVRERFYAVSSERRIKSPGVLAICSSARTELFAPP